MHGDVRYHSLLHERNGEKLVEAVQALMLRLDEIDWKRVPSFDASLISLSECDHSVPNLEVSFAVTTLQYANACE